MARAAHGIPRLDPRKFQGKRWATRARPWVDRLACAWLIREAAGLEAVLAGLREVHADDDHLGLAAAAVFDTLHAAPGTSTAAHDSQSWCAGLFGTCSATGAIVAGESGCLLPGGRSRGA